MSKEPTPDPHKEPVRDDYGRPATTRFQKAEARIAQLREQDGYGSRPDPYDKPNFWPST